MSMIGRLGAGAVALAMALLPLGAWAQSKIEFFFPVPVEGKLAKEMTRLVKVYNDSQKEVAVTAVYTGSYDETKLKAQAAAGAGKPPAVSWCNCSSPLKSPPPLDPAVPARPIRIRCQSP